MSFYSAPNIPFFVISKRMIPIMRPLHARVSPHTIADDEDTRVLRQSDGSSSHLRVQPQTDALLPCGSDENAAA